jgi:hypothetical protein
MDDGTAAALEMWSGFPVDAAPRPLVLTGPTAGSPGFRTVEAKEAYHAGALLSEVDVPLDVLSRLRPHPQMQRQDHPLRVLAAERTTAEFQTDRGPRLLPAYRVEIEDAIDPAYVLDPEVEATAWWPQDLSPELRGLEGGRSAELQDDGRTITVFVWGALPTYSDVRVSAVLESASAVMVLTEETIREGIKTIPLAAAQHAVVVTFAAPLGARVLVHPSGFPLTVEHA